ncbi:hypothetical protein CBL_00449 [Carabus blaptoides fortunei]
MIYNTFVVCTTWRDGKLNACALTVPVNVQIANKHVTVIGRGGWRGNFGISERHGVIWKGNRTGAKVARSVVTCGAIYKTSILNICSTILAVFHTISLGERNESTNDENRTHTHAIDVKQREGGTSTSNSAVCSLCY